MVCCINPWAARDVPVSPAANPDENPSGPVVRARAEAILKASVALEQEDPLASAEVLLAEHSQITMSMTRDALAIRDRKN